MGLESLNGRLAGGPTAVASGSDRLDVFGVEAGTGHILHWWRDGGNWIGPQPLPMANVSVPAAVSVGAVSWGQNRLDVFAAANPGSSLYQWWWDGATWFGPVLWQSGPRGLPAESVTALSRGANRLDVFAVEAGSGQLLHWEYDQGIFQLAMPHRGRMNAQGIGAVAWAPNRLDIFGIEVGTGVGASGPGQLLHWSWAEGQGWGENEHRGGSLNAQTVSAVSWGPNRLDVFAVEAGSGQLLHWAWNGAAWLDAERRGGVMDTQGVSAVSPGPNRLEVFGVEKGTNQLLRWSWDGVRWTDAQSIEAWLPSGDVSAVGRAGHRLDVFARGADNSLQHWPGGIRGVSPGSWTNWAGNQSTNVEGHCAPTSLEELVAIVKTAARYDKRVRAVGSGWSFSDIALTSGYLVETNKLDKLILDAVVPNALLAPHATSPQPRHLVHVEAGIQLEKLLMILDADPLTLPAGAPLTLPARAPHAMGGASGQTLAGVLSTSVHGSHFHLPPFPDWVRAIHLIGPDGLEHWIEPSDRPITDRVKLQAAIGPEVHIHYDNDWFNAALVTVGGLGIIYSVVFEVRDQYKLKETRAEIPWLALREQFVDKRWFTGPDDVLIAIDPGTMGSNNPSCYLSTRAEVPVSTTSTNQPASFDPLAAFCESDFLLQVFFEAARAAGREPAVLGAILGSLWALPAVGLILSPFLPVLLPVLVVGGTLVAATPVLLQILKAAGPGAIGDLVGILLDKEPGLTARVVTELTRSNQNPGVAIDIAHQVMARRNKGICATRGSAIEIAFDTADESHLQFLDAALAMLKDEFAMGRVLGGYFAIRFVGRSKAMLSPHRSDLTCTVEVVGLRTLSSTKVLLGHLEVLGRSYGGIQHWGMFEDLNADDVARSYPQLDTWLRVRHQLTNNGAVRTFDNKFMDRCGLIPTAKPKVLLRNPSDGAVYVIYGGAKFHIPDPATLSRMFAGVPIRDAQAGELEHIGNAPGDGTLFQEETTGKVFAIVSGAISHVPDWDTLNQLYPGFLLRPVWDGALDQIRWSKWTDISFLTPLLLSQP